jgi:F-type H+-transporting ATPase subunit gamma
MVTNEPPSEPAALSAAAQIAAVANSTRGMTPIAAATFMSTCLEIGSGTPLPPRCASTISDLQTLLPLTPSGQVCTVNGVCVDAKDDEVFALTTEEGKFAVKREAAPVDTSGAVFDGVITFEQDPNQILDALLPLYMNSQVLRALQESIASELAARMTAMGAASDNAKSLGKTLNLAYNRQRQAAITTELVEIISGAEAL